MRMSTPDVSVAVLAGGQSRRMGADKSFVMLDGQPLIGHVIECVAQLNVPIHLITNTPEKYAAFGLPMYGDDYPNCGSLGGLYTAVNHGESGFVLCVACDMPFLNVPLLRHLISLRSDYDAVTPCVAGTMESLHAVYSRDCLPWMQSQIERGQLRISDLHRQLHALIVAEPMLRAFDPELRSFINLNTPYQLSLAQEAVR